MSIIPALLAPVADPKASMRALKESWRYTNLRVVEGTEFVPATPAPLAAESLPPLTVAGAQRLVFVDGVCDSTLSTALPKGMIFHGATLTIDPSVAGKSVEILFVTLPDATISTARAATFALDLAANSTATLIERHIALSAHSGVSTLTTVHISMRLADGARLTHLRLQEAGASELHFARTDVALAKDAQYRTLGITVGGAQSRYETAVEFLESGASCNLAGLYLQKDVQRAETVTDLKHLVPRCQSEQSFRGIVSGKAKGSFLGRISVAKDAQKTIAYQSHKALPLSRETEINAKPELEILADDVKCSHGIAIGALDLAALFYLRSRGIPESLARLLLVEAFAEETIAAIEDPALIAAAEAIVRGWLGVQA